LFHNVRALVVDHDAVTRNVVFNDKLLALPSTGIPTTGVCAVSRSHQRQDRERRRNVKKNAVAAALQPGKPSRAHLDVWTREVADIRIHGTTGEVLIARFTRAEAKEADQRHPAVPRHARADPACRL
jgi:hypothetical protein